jgi:hypothetical protein
MGIQISNWRPRAAWAGKSTTGAYGSTTPTGVAAARPASTRSSSTTSASRPTATSVDGLPHGRRAAVDDDLTFSYAASRAVPAARAGFRDVFGLPASRDLGIGQSPKRIGKVLDAIYPMVYPSHTTPASTTCSGPRRSVRDRRTRPRLQQADEGRGRCTSCPAPGLHDQVLVRPRAGGQQIGAARTCMRRVPALEPGRRVHVERTPASHAVTLTRNHTLYMPLGRHTRWRYPEFRCARAY